ncbi:hypothetical protein ACSQ76_12360 [Roseovarius sp. B08]|uniref:hypothetical protein n=1 Tax=Roseovarius sp. B08 TaxID=3449223 RepID=UPI003EDB92F0
MKYKAMNRNSPASDIAGTIVDEAIALLSRYIGISRLNAHTCIIDLLLAAVGRISPEGSIQYIEVLLEQAHARKSGDQAAYEATYDAMKSALAKMESDRQVLAATGKVTRQ